MHRRVLPLLLVAMALYSSVSPAQQLNLPVHKPASNSQYITSATEQTVAVGEETDLIITGLTREEMEAARDRDDVRLVIWPDSNVKIDPSYNWWTKGLSIEFKATKAGDYLVMLLFLKDRASPQLEDVSFIVHVTGDGGSDVNPPQPSGPRKIVLVEESGDTEGSQTIARLLDGSTLVDYLNQQGHHLFLADKDDKTETGSVPQVLAPYLGQLPDTLPVLFVATESDQILYKGAIPASVEELIAIIKKNGG